MVRYERLVCDHMKKSLVGGALVFVLTALALAQNKTARPDIDELLTLTRVQKTSESAIEHVKSMMADVAKQTNVSPDAAEKTKTMQDKMFTLIESEMGWNKMKTEYARVYAEVFSPDEVRGLIAFYKTPVGQAFLDKQPLLMQKTMEMAQKRMMDVMPKVQEMVSKDIGTTTKEDRPEATAGKK
jgi:hypothetical protein